MFCFVVINAFLLTSCGQLAAFRANSILLYGSPFKMKKKTFVIFIGILYFALSLLVIGNQILIREEQNGMENAREFLKTDLQFSSLHSPDTAKSLFLIDTTKFYAHSFLLLTCFMVILSNVWILFSSSIMVFQIYSKLISIQSARQVKQYLIGVQLQISPCIICYLIPTCWLVSSMILNIEFVYGQVLNDLACLFTVCQSPLSMVVVFYLNPEYRRYLKSRYTRASSKVTVSTIFVLN